MEITIILCAFAAMLGSRVMYVKFGWFKSFFHDVLGWHEPDDSPMWSDGCSTHSRCKYCGAEIMQDSQGNWFRL